MIVLPQSTVLKVYSRIEVFAGAVSVAVPEMLA